MPKINVYLPDELAEAVKQAGVPVSAICQRALEQAVRRVTAIREMALVPQDLDEPTGALAHLTPRTRVVVVKLAQEAARADGATSVGTEHLLAGMLSEGANLALHVLRAMDVDPEQAGRDLSRHRPAQEPEGATDGDAPLALSTEAANALELTVTEATSLGHNYVGCEHLLLGLVAEPDGIAGQVLRGLGAEPRLTRRAVVAALAGHVHLRAQAQQDTLAAQGGASAQGEAGAAVQARLAAAIRQELQPFVQRLERLEERLGPDT
ncbi:Clp protease N-terminal domain-containing protein [Nonomuraea diastatica]|uniref:ATP-dependent Clp protease ATP-binding subunit n=1 Tax=Nonomuraea diastatica TaxID=1848329 RepID=A0A4R4VXN5_9ACTN|nr:Clp protease N-terminal domain-containing protein [Nonomuraea diastatica]TDD09137.1 ATP-dependent Clp protease ATP-binding subunit [Nonomuraea diastatica]